MKSYKDSNGTVWAFEENGSQDHLILSDMREISGQELYLHLNPPPSRADLEFIETQWRDIEMPLAQQNVTAIEYGEKGVPGTAQQWQKYWLALRKWTDANPDFPDSAKRPVAPT